MDKYAGIQCNKWGVYWFSWLPNYYFHFMYMHNGKSIYCLRHNHKVNPVFLGNFNRLDTKLEQLWQKHQSKSEVEA